MDGKCFALNGGNCSALTIPRCTGRCKFYKTSAQLRAERNDSYGRLV